MDWLNTLRRLKNTTNETYKSIAEKTNIPQTTIEKLFNGRTKDPKLYMIRDVVHCLGYTLDDLLEENNSRQYTSTEQSLIENYRTLNPEGQQKATDYVEDLAVNPKYMAEPPKEKTSEEIMKDLDEYLASRAQIAAYGGNGVKKIKPNASQEELREIYNKLK